MSKYKQLFIMTTDTVVGIGAPVSKENKEAINYLKTRDKKKSLIIMVGSLEQARSFKEWDKKAEALAAEVWPGPVTIALNDKIALRMPDNTAIQNFIKQTGPIYSTSANLSGEPVLSFAEAKKHFQEITEYYYFGEGNGKPSTIIKAEDREVIR